MRLHMGEPGNEAKWESLGMRLYKGEPGNKDTGETLHLESVNTDQWAILFT